MWKLVEISQHTYFMYCNLNTNSQEVTFILYDLKQTWSQTLTLVDVKQKVKLLNKRFDFSEDNIKEALTSDAPQSVAIEDQPHTSAINADSCLLKLKYRVKNCVLNYEWNLKRQTLLEFQKTFVQPVLMALLGCHQQVEILTENLRKKDIELEQYRIEKGLLNRKTLATKPFDFDDFNKKYEDSNKIVINFRELAKYVKENDSNKVHNILHTEVNVNKIDEDAKPEEKSNDVQNTYTKMSPRQRKRKAKEQKLEHLEKHLKLRKQGLEYESSQSQTPSSGNSQNTDETEAKEQKEKSSKQVIVSKPQNASSPRKSTRCTPTKQKREYISSEDKTDSEDDHLSMLRGRKTRRDSVKPTAEVSTNSSKEHTPRKPENNNAKETRQKSVTTLNLSYNSQKKSVEKSSESSNVFDFDDDEPPSKDKKKLSQAKRSNLTLRGDRSRLMNVSPVAENIIVESMVTISSTSPRTKNMSHSPTPVVMDELSSQLSNIKKELESLEAMRLADLKQRMCKV